MGIITLNQILNLLYTLIRKPSVDLTLGFCSAGGEGFEPPQTDPESAVLPLDEPPKRAKIILPRCCLKEFSDILLTYLIGFVFLSKHFHRF